MKQFPTITQTPNHAIAQSLTPFSRAWAYVALTKPDVTFLVLLTTFAGFYMGAAGPLDLVRLVHTLAGTVLVAAGTSALNHYFERDSDAKMRRTAHRPLPLGLLQPGEAFAFGAGLALAGTVYLAAFVNGSSSALAAATCLSYLAAYTPLKKSPPAGLATLVGAFPGAVPPLIGWAAASATGGLPAAAWLLYAILFCWQFPHFLAIAWMYREDYARAGIQMLPVVDPSGQATFRQIVAVSVALVPASLLPAVMGIAGMRYFFGALVLGMMMVQTSLWAARSKTNLRAKWLMHATVLYLPALLGLLMFDKTPR